MARAKWLAAREADLLPVRYFHVVFTVPPVIAAIALQNKKVLYDILLRASAQTLLQVAADPKHLGAKLAILSVLHTWGQTLMHHPHVHCVVPGGGIAPDGDRWIACRPNFFLPVRVLSRVFRGKFLAMVRRAFTDGKLSFQCKLASLQDPTAFKAYLKRAYDHDWVVYAKKPFGGPVQVLRYLARYTHRVAISNHRLLSLEGGHVRFSWKDYKAKGKRRVMSLDAIEFLRRFLLHVLTRGFMRIRSYGLLANAHRAELLKLCRSLLSKNVDADDAMASTDEGRTPAVDEPHLPRCPKCERGQLIRVLVLPAPAAAASALEPFDTS